MRTGPFAALTRYFVGAMLAPPILSDLGADYLRRTIASLVAMMLIAGVFLTQAFFRKYADLGGLTYPDAYLRALQSDTLFMIAVPMLIVGLAAVLLCPMLFPDETDYQVLTPLPLTRAVVFGAKLTAVVIAGGIVVLAVSAISGFWFPLATGGRRAPYPALARVAAHAAASVAGSAWMFSAVAALQGLTLALAPARWRRIGLVMQAMLIVVLLVSVSFVAKLPATLVSSDTVRTMPLAAFPPTWFFGFEQWLLDPCRTDGYAAAAAIGGTAALGTTVLILVSYAVLYRTAEQLAGVSRSNGRVSGRWSRLSWVESRLQLRPPFAAVLDFIVKGLARSRLHQFVFVLIAGAGAAILIEQVATVMHIRPLPRMRVAVHAALAAPLLAALAVTLGLRAAFLLPADRAAAWVFRLTEDPDTRTSALDAVAWFCTGCVLIAALAVALIVQPGMFGASWLFAAALSGLASLVAVEVVLADWHRIPFTCSYLPGKRVLAYNLGVLLGGYFVFVYMGAHLLRWSLAAPLRTGVVAGLLISGCAALRRSRRRSWGLQPLDFEDDDPLAVRTLGLLPDEH